MSTTTWINGYNNFNGTFPHWWDKRKTIDFLRDGKGWPGPKQFNVTYVRAYRERQWPGKKEKNTRKVIHFSDESKIIFLMKRLNCTFWPPDLLQWCHHDPHEARGESRKGSSFYKGHLMFYFRLIFVYIWSWLWLGPCRDRQDLPAKW